MVSGLEIFFFYRENEDNFHDGESFVENEGNSNLKRQNIYVEGNFHIQRLRVCFNERNAIYIPLIVLMKAILPYKCFQHLLMDWPSLLLNVGVRE